MLRSWRWNAMPVSRSPGLGVARGVEDKPVTSAPPARNPVN
jgi:hypothetical protein